MNCKPEVIGYRRDGSPMLWVENLKDGESIVCDSRMLRRASAWLASQRLRNVIQADRAADPCGRWVRLRPKFTELMRWQTLAAQNFAFGLAAPVPPRPATDRRPRYRWEVRR